MALKLMHGYTFALPSHCQCCITWPVMLGTVKCYVRLIRCKHYIKNVLIFTPLLFAGKLFSWGEPLLYAIMGFVTFCLLSSSVYIINDIRDVDKDRQHPAKCKRPIAVGRISVQKACAVAAVCVLGVVCTSFYLGFHTSWLSAIFPLTYFLLNLGYSFGLKNKPLIEIAILASGFVFRVLYGGYVSAVEVSDWLYLTVICVSLYLALGKRRNELERHGDKTTRKVLRYYSRAFLDKNMYLFLCLAIGFYSLWAIGHSRPLMLWSIPFVMFISMRYSLRVEGSSEGDPVDMILKDKTLIGMGLLYSSFLIVALYF